MSDVTHAKCPRCSTYEPIVWTRIVTESISNDGRALRFEGMQIKCRTCDMDITSVGAIEHRSYVA